MCRKHGCHGSYDPFRIVKEQIGKVDQITMEMSTEYIEGVKK